MRRQGFIIGAVLIEKFLVFKPKLHITSLPNHKRTVNELTNSFSRNKDTLPDRNVVRSVNDLVHARGRSDGVRSNRNSVRSVQDFVSGKTVVTAKQRQRDKKAPLEML